MIQVSIIMAVNAGNLNEQLRLFQQEYPKRKITSVSCVPAEPAGWFATICYEVNI